MTYYFSGIDELLLEAFRVLLRSCPGNIRHFLAMLVMPGRMPGYHRYDLQLTGCNAGNMELMYQLYALASRKPLLKT